VVLSLVAIVRRHLITVASVSPTTVRGRRPPRR
jgi:hypothetical protein